MPEADSLPENPYRAPRESGPGPGGTLFRDRKALIQVMGILAIVAGVGFGCLGGLYAAMPALMAMAPPEVREANLFGSGWMKLMLASAGLSLGVIGGALVWLGSGAVRLRRWAGDLFLATGWLAGVFSVISVVSALWMLPQSMAAINEEMRRAAPGTPPNALMAQQVIMVVTMVTMFFFYLVPPLTVILVFRMQSVKETFARYDQGRSWTDGLALPVLAWWVWLIALAVCMLLGAPLCGMIYQMTGLVAHAWQGSVIIVLFAGLAAFCAWTIVKRKPWSWYASLGLSLLMGGLAVAMSGMDLLEIYRKMGMTEEQLRPMAATYGDGSVYRAIGLVTLVILFAFLLSTRRRFRFSSQPPSALT